MPVTTPPIAPDPNDPATYPARGDAMMAWFPVMTDEINELEENVEAKRDEAVAAAATAVAAPGTSATSTTSVAIGTGAKSFTIQTGKSLVAGMFVAIAQTSNPDNWMHGSVTSYNPASGALVVGVKALNGSGTYTDWTISISPPILLTKATPEQIWAGTSESVAATPASILASAAPVQIADGSTITLDLKAGVAFEVTTPISGDRILANPTNMIPGQWFSVRLVEDGVARAITVGSYWDFGDVTPRLSGANKATKIVGFVRDFDHIEASIAKGFRP